MGVNNAELIAAVDKLKAMKLVKRDSELASQIGYSATIVSEYLNNKKPVSELFMRKLYDKFPQVHSGVINLQKQKSSAANASAISSENPVMMVPLVSKYAYAGYLSGYGDDEYIEELPKIPFLVDKERKGNYRAFEVKGDSMDNGLIGSFREGYIVLGREVGKQHWRDKLHINKWKTFVLVTKTDGILIKEIAKHNTEKGIITLRSLNEEYKDFELSLDNVAQLFNVVKFIGE